MPDILTHALVGYALATLLSFRYRWLTPPYVTVAMMGALIPDMVKIKILLPSAQMEALLGIPFSWDAIHTVGGSFVAVLIGTALAGAGYRRRVFGLLLFGTLSHHVLDALLLNPSGYSYDVLWPLTGYHFPTPNLFLSTDRWPAVVAGAAALCVYYARYRYQPTATRAVQNAD
ncbi:metal-dependent hydrolase [Haloferacaceae archaeon DSL9]